MPVLCCQLTVPPQNDFLRQQFLSVPRVMGSDLRCRCAIGSLFAQMVFNLFSSWTGRLQVLSGVASDFGLAMLAALQFIAQHLEPHCQFGSVNCRHVSLRNEQFVRLEATRSSVCLLSYVEDDGMRVQLRCGVTINGTGGIVFKGSSYKLAGGLWRVNIADTGLR